MSKNYKEQVMNVADKAKGLAKSKIVWTILIIGLISLVVFGIVGTIMYKKTHKNVPTVVQTELSTESKAKLPEPETGNAVDDTDINNGSNASV
jgi:uncharacterized membrane protein